MRPVVVHVACVLSPPWHTEFYSVSTQSTNGHQLESGDCDDVVCAYVLQSLGHFGANATVDVGMKLNEQQCHPLESFNHP